MNHVEAKAECQRWLDYLDRQKAKAGAVQKLASDRRLGRISEEDGKRLLRQLDNHSSVTVYDGSRLADAVKYLIGEDVTAVNLGFPLLGAWGLTFKDKNGKCINVALSYEQASEMAKRVTSPPQDR